MLKFIVRQGYAYYHPNIKNGFPAGSIIELEDITFGDQQWKLEPVLEQDPTTPLQSEGSSDSQAPASIPSEEKPVGKKLGRPPKVKV